MAVGRVRADCQMACIINSMEDKENCLRQSMLLWGLKIDTTLGLKTIEKYLMYFSAECDPNLPTTVIMALLSLVMKNCTFKLGDSLWKQTSGTVMGTRCACIYAILFVAY